MVRWAWKRWVCAGLLGVVVAGPGAFAQTSPPVDAGSVAAAKDGPRPNDTVTLRFPGQPDRKVMVTKVSTLANGNVESEVIDPHAGKRYTLIEPARPRAVAPPPMFPVATPTAQAPVEDDATVQAGGSDRRILGMLRPSPPPAPNPDASSGILVRPTLKPPTATPTPTVTTPDAGAASADDPTKRPGPLQRLFGKRSMPSTTMPSMPAPASPSVTPPPSPAPTPSFPPPVSQPLNTFPPPPVSQPSNTIPPPPPPFPMPMPTPGTVQPKPMPMPGTVQPPPMPSPGTVQPKPQPVTTPAPLPIPAPPMTVPNTTAEPPRAFAPKPMTQPVTPVTPPTPVIPNSVPVPTAPPVTTAVPAPVPAPSLPVPLPNPVPKPMPTAPGGGPLPVIPLPGGQSRATGPAVMQAGGNVPPYLAMPQDIQPYVNVLHNALPPSHRILAAEALANGRHGSSSAVKAMLFNAAKNDPAPVVRACCIEKLCKLGYFEPAFLDHVNASCNDPSEVVRDAAKAAQAKMTLRQP